MRWQYLQYDIGLTDYCCQFYKAMSVDPSVTRTLVIVKRLIPPLNEEEESDESEEGVDDDDEEDEYNFDMFHMVADKSSFSSSLSGSLIPSVQGPMRVSLAIGQKKRMTATRRTFRESTDEGRGLSPDCGAAAERAQRTHTQRLLHPSPHPPLSPRWREGGRGICLRNVLRT